MKTGEAVAFGFKGRMYYFHFHCAQGAHVKSILARIKKHVVLKKVRRARRPSITPNRERPILGIHATSAAHEPDNDTKQIPLEQIIASIKHYGPSTRKQIADREGIDKSTVGFRLHYNAVHNPKSTREIFKIVGYTSRKVQLWGLIDEEIKEAIRKQENEQSKSLSESAGEV